MKRILLLLPLFLLCGCWDYNEAAMQEYVLGVGIDRTDDGYLVTIETADLSGSPESPSTAKTISCKGGSLFDAIRNAIPHAGKKLYWGHCALMVFDDAIEEAQLHEVLDVFLRAQDVYQSVAVCVAHNASAADVFASEYVGSDSVTAHCLHIFQNQASSRRFQKRELWEYVQRDGFVILPTVTVENNVAQISGGAVYRDKALLGMLSGDEMLLVSLCTAQIPGGWIPNIPILPHVSVSTEILAENISVKEDLLSLTLTLAVSSSDAAFDLTDETTRKSAERTIAHFLETQINTLMERAAVCGFSELIHPIARNAAVSVRLQNSGMRTSEGRV